MHEVTASFAGRRPVKLDALVIRYGVVELDLRRAQSRAREREARWWSGTMGRSEGPEAAGPVREVGVGVGVGVGVPVPVGANIRMDERGGRG